MSGSNQVQRNVSERLAAWLRGLFTITATGSIAYWFAVYVEPSHSASYLLIIGTFFASTLRIVAEPRG